MMSPYWNWADLYNSPNVFSQSISPRRVTFSKASVLPPDGVKPEVSIASRYNSDDSSVDSGWLIDFHGIWNCLRVFHSESRLLYIYIILLSWFLRGFWIVLYDIMYFSLKQTISRIFLFLLMAYQPWRVI